MTPKALTLTVGDTGNITATVEPDDATNQEVTWTSSDEAVATVDANGKVTAVAAGTATITVTTDDGGYAATVTVIVVVPQDIQVKGNGFVNANPASYLGVFVELLLPGNDNDKIQSLKVELFNENDELIGTNTLKSMSSIGSTLTSPFVVIPGEYESGSWTTTWVDGELSASNAPAKAVITAVDTNGLSYSAEAKYTGDWASIWPVAMIGTTQYDSIQAAIDAAVVGDNLIMVYPANHGTGSINIIQQQGVNITLEAVGEVELKNQIQIDGNGRSEGKETLTVKGFIFNFSTSEGDIISTSMIKSTSGHVYAHNISIEDCKFIGNQNGVVVAVRAAAQGGHYDFEIKNCTGEYLHSLAQLSAVTGVTITNCTVSNSTSGLNLNHSTNMVIDNFDYEGAGHGIRVGQSSGTPKDEFLIIKNSKIISNNLCTEDNLGDPDTAIVLRGDAPKNITIEDSTISNSNSESFDIANKNSANAKEYIFTFTNVIWGADGMFLGGGIADKAVKVYDANEALKGLYNTIQEAVAKAVAGDRIEVAAGTYDIGTIVLTKPISIIGVDDSTATNGTIINGVFEVASDNVKGTTLFKNLEFTTLSKPILIGTEDGQKLDKIVIDGVVFAGDSHATKYRTISPNGDYPELKIQELTIKNSKFGVTLAVYLTGDIGTLEISNNEFNVPNVHWGTNYAAVNINQAVNASNSNSPSGIYTISNNTIIVPSSAKAEYYSGVITNQRYPGKSVTAGKALEASGNILKVGAEGTLVSDVFINDAFAVKIPEATVSTFIEDKQEGTAEEEELEEAEDPVNEQEAEDDADDKDEQVNTEEDIENGLEGEVEAADEEDAV